MPAYARLEKAIKAEPLNTTHKVYSNVIDVTRLNLVFFEQMLKICKIALAYLRMVFMRTTLSVTSAPAEPLAACESMEAICAQVHPDCFICAPNHPFGLNLPFLRTGSFQVEARWNCNRYLQGYPGELHGGVIATLIDAAMVHALMAEGIQAATANLSVRYLARVNLDKEIIVMAERRQVRGPAHHMVATIKQGGVTRATGRARFFDRDRSMGAFNPIKA